MYATKALLCLTILLVHLSALTQASCGFAEARFERTRFGTEVRYCEYKGLNLLPGSWLIDKDDCMAITCNAHGMSMCGYDVNAGVRMPPPGCRIVSDGCEPRYIPMPGSRTRCPT
ncbi:beta-microseminoprotein-like [Liolophura sinensis]|uniref:beta-microseminoprotein-like n=1 Tax=Liolophura sinensis TaxID=3198878 RepID=UPI0031593FE0